MEYRVFICHSYWHRKIYFDLIQKLNDAGRFKWRNVSVQYDMRFGSGDEDVDDGELRNEIGAKIAACDVFLALTKPIASRRRWLQYEIMRAKELGKPIIGISRMRNDRVSAFVKQHAIDIVDTWRADQIISAIEHYGDEYRAAPQINPPLSTADSLPQDLPDIEVEPTPSPDLPVQAEVRAAPQPHQSPRDVLYRGMANSAPERQMPLLKEPVWWRAPRRLM